MLTINCMRTSGCVTERSLFLVVLSNIPIPRGGECNPALEELHYSSILNWVGFAPNWWLIARNPVLIIWFGRWWPTWRQLTGASMTR